ncbi:hypothetical protein GCM10010430_11020 [Kitasatospora cystarginea]|uniref:Uncharacterized protein n=1 Tax=Kitasatospora cystarginea TaxID=58350 RepID=A0ABP5QD17_9ACTN
MPDPWGHGDADRRVALDGQPDLPPSLADSHMYVEVIDSQDLDVCSTFHCYILAPITDIPAQGRQSEAPNLRPAVSDNLHQLIS